MKGLTKADFDQLGDYDRVLLPFLSTISAREKLRKKIVAGFEDELADQPCQGEGERWTIKLTPRAMVRVFKPGAIKRLALFLGEQFFKIANVPLGLFDDNVTVLDRSKYVVEEQIGYRKVEAIEKPLASKKAA